MPPQYAVRGFACWAIWFAPNDSVGAVAPIMSAPPLTVVAPLTVSAPVSVSVPEPAFVRLPSPEMALASVTSLPLVSKIAVWPLARAMNWWRRPACCRWPTAGAAGKRNAAGAERTIGERERAAAERRAAAVIVRAGESQRARAYVGEAASAGEDAAVGQGAALTLALSRRERGRGLTLAVSRRERGRGLDVEGDRAIEAQCWQPPPRRLHLSQR